MEVGATHPLLPPYRVASGVASGDASDWRERLSSRLPQRRWRTRFAPAPTGYLHFGHLVNALYVWGVARAYGGEVALRIEDHDRTRCRPEYERALLDDLDWLGLSADVATTQSFRDSDTRHAFRQSDNTWRYAAALSALTRAADVYPCACSRRTLGAPTGGAERRYAGACRARTLDPSIVLARRVKLAEDVVHFDDLRLGARADTPAQQCGDLLVRDGRGDWTYQFAVVVDDAAHDIDVVIRGEDLLPSTARQLTLRRLLAITRPLEFFHHPLVVGPSGMKLSKSSHDTSLRALRSAGVTPQWLLGQAAHVIGLTAAPRSLAASDIADLFVV